MKAERILSLDVFCGITVAAMILVNNPGSWEHVYPPLLHAHWNGCTPTDLIFPFFLFIVGMSIHFAYQSKKSEGLTKKIFWKIAKRAVIIFLLGIFLAWFPIFSLERLSHLRIPGVLQRISIVFFIASLLYLSTHWITQIRITVLILFAYYILMTMVPVPGMGSANLEPETNLGAWLDRYLLEGHLWSQSKTWDPEGLLSTLPAIGTGLLGLLIGQYFSTFKTIRARTWWLFLIGIIVMLIGLLWDFIFPINKSLWTSSFVLFTGGIAIQVFSICYWLLDVRGWKAWATPFTYYGTNAIFVFVASGLLVKTLSRIKVGEGEKETSLWSYGYQHFYEPYLAPKNASLAFALTLILFFYFILRWMYHRKIFIKV